MTYKSFAPSDFLFAPLVFPPLYLSDSDIVTWPV